MSVRAFVDRRLGDLAAAGVAADVAAAEWGLAEPALLRHGMNAIYRCGEVVLRVAEPNAPAELSIELAETLRDVGISALRPARPEVVRHEGLSVTAWDHVASDGAAVDWHATGAMIARVHGLDADVLPSGLPHPSPAAFPWWDFGALLDEVGDLIDRPALEGIIVAIERWRHWADFDEAVVCHGDVHTGNVIMSANGPVLIDWDLLCLAPRGWDHAPLMTWGHPWEGDAGVYEALAAGYGWSARGDDQSEAFAHLRLVAATLMRVKAGASDAVARPEADRRLAYWRGDADAPAWHAQ